MNLWAVRVLADLRDRARLEAEVHRLADDVAAANAGAQGLAEANHTLGSALRIARSDLELAYRRIAGLKESVQDLEKANDDLTAALAGRPDPARMDVVPAGPTHPQCLDAARRVCKLCAPALGYHVPRDVVAEQIDGSVLVVKP